MGNHSSRLVVTEKLKRPTRKRRLNRFKHKSGQLFKWRFPIWSCTARSLPSRACYQTRWCALTLSFLNRKPHRFTHHHDLKIVKSEIRNPESKIEMAGLFSVALVVTRFIQSNARTLSGSLPYWCSDFPLPIFQSKAITRLAPLQGSSILAKNVQQLQFKFLRKYKFLK